MLAVPTLNVRDAHDVITGGQWRDLILCLMALWVWQCPCQRWSFFQRILHRRTFDMACEAGTRAPKWNQGGLWVEYSKQKCWVKKLLMIVLTFFTRKPHCHMNPYDACRFCPARWYLTLHSGQASSKSCWNRKANVPWLPQMHQAWPSTIMILARWNLRELHPEAGKTHLNRRCFCMLSTFAIPAAFWGSTWWGPCSTCACVALDDTCRAWKDWLQWASEGHCPGFKGASEVAVGAVQRLDHRRIFALGSAWGKRAARLGTDSFLQPISAA